MTRIFADVALAIGGSPAASMIAKVTATMVLALAGVRLARKSRAAVRHALLVAAFAVSLALPMTSILIPSARLVQVPIVVNKIAESPALPSPAGFAPAVDPVRPIPTERAMIPASRLSASVPLLIGWATGAVLFLLPVLVGMWQVHRLRQSGRPWQHGQSVVQQLAADVNIHRRVEVLLHEAVSGPGSYGVVRPTILLPMDAQTWHGDDLSRAIIHELEHVRRGDWVSQCFARVLCACYWFHPLVWIARQQLALEAERACDDAVLRRADATAYANQLVVLAERMSAVPNRALLTMANRTDFAARVVAVLDSQQQRGRVGKVCLALVCVTSTLLVTTISPLRIVAGAQTQAPTQTFSGSLMDPLGRPLPDTRLTLWNTSSQQAIEARSDQAARFTFSGIAAGEYFLQVHEFGSQGRITLEPGQHLHRDIAVVMDGVDDTITVLSSEAAAALPPPPAPLPPPSSASQTYPDQAALDRCAQASMFCRVTPPVQIARVQPIYPAKEHESKEGWHGGRRGSRGNRRTRQGSACTRARRSRLRQLNH
jgi:beta-lactamase regulating signal transducer with metallopeptidase domain